MMALIGCAVALWQLAADKGVQQHQSADYQQGPTSQLTAQGRIGGASDAPAGQPHEQKAEQSVGPGTWPDWAIVAFTLMLTLLGWLQYRLDRRTARETRDALKIAKDGAAAAKLSAEAATALATAATEANQLTRAQFLEAHRPRIAATAVSLQKAEILTDGSLSIQIGVLARNSGNVPGLEVSAHLKLNAIGGSAADEEFRALTAEFMANSAKAAPLAVSMDAGESRSLFAAPVNVSSDDVATVRERSRFVVSLSCMLAYSHSSPRTWNFSICLIRIEYRGESGTLVVPGVLQTQAFEVEILPVLALQS